jgi:hypothetical protein
MADTNTAMEQMMMSGFYSPNKYSNFQNQRLPMPGYVGAPTDALGRPIQPPPGMTLNTPAPPAATPPPPAAPAAPNYLAQQIEQAPGNPQQGSFGGGGGSGNGALLTQMLLNQPGPGAAAAAQPAVAPQAAAPQAGGSLDNALSLLANPGKVTTPGATGAPNRGPSVLNAFLAANPGMGGQGAGNYNNQPFFNTLNALRAQGTPQ